MHTEIMKGCAKKLEKDAKHHAKDAKKVKGKKKKNENVEEKEVKSVVQDLKKRARKSG